MYLFRTINNIKISREDWKWIIRVFKTGKIEKRKKRSKRSKYLLLSISALSDAVDIPHAHLMSTMMCNIRKKQS